MEFKRIDDTKFQCLLDEEDLEDNNISLDDFFRNDTSKIHGLLDVILEEAQKTIGIIFNGGVMSLQLAPQPNHSVLLTISSGHDEFSDMIKHAGEMMSSFKSQDSNVIKRDEADDSIKAAPFVSVDKLEDKIQAKQKESSAAKQKTDAQPENAVAVYQFASMQDAEEFAAHAPKTWGVKNSLYKDTVEKTFYLVLEKTRCAEEKFQYLCGLLTEYSEYISSKRETTAYIREHFDVLIENNAVNIMKKYCI